jgi:hypothetical protein
MAQVFKSSPNLPGQNIKAQFESPKKFNQTTFETLKYLKQARF